MDIPLNLIDEPVDVLRPVQRRGVEFLELKQSIADNGFLNSILVRPHGEGRYQVVDGLHRFTIAKLLGMESIPTEVKVLTDEEVLIRQLEANGNFIPTRESDVARRYKRLLKMNPSWTLADLSSRVHKSPVAIQTRLNLLDLSEEHLALVDRGAMTLSNAALLARLPHTERDAYVDKAVALSTSDFAQLAGPVVKNHWEQIVNGKFVSGPREPSCVLKNMVTIRNEIKKPTVAGPVIARECCETLVDAFLAGLKWTLSVDAISLATRRAQQLSIQKLKENEDE